MFLISLIFNVFTIATSKHIKLIPELCIPGDPFTVNHQKPTISGVLSALVNTNKKCLSDYSLLKVKRNGGIVDLEICYDELLLKTIYVKFEIDGISLKNFDSVIIPPPVTQNIKLYPENIACYYTKKHQAALFKYIYNNEDAITDSSFLIEGHLTSNSDFSEHYKQLGTFFHANITPQWKSINQHAWARIESAIRSYAMDMDRVLEAYAGTHGQAAVAGGQPLFLTGDGRMPVAAWLWKAVVDRSAGAGVAFVCSNDPFRPTAAAGGPPCGGADVCVDGHWDDAAVAGTSYCCTLRQLVETIPEAAVVISGVGADAGLLKRPLPVPPSPPPPTSPENVSTADDDDDDDYYYDDDDDDDSGDDADADDVEEAAVKGD